MDIIAWLGWAVVTVLGVLWSIVWFLISGWVFTMPGFDPELTPRR
jgi:hypothetical protein